MRPRGSPNPAQNALRIGVVIPCFRVREHILGVLAAIPELVFAIYVVDDACPEGSGVFVQSACVDPRVRVVFNATNQGVGGAMVTGYEAAIADNMDIVVKLDGDGQMNPAFIPILIRPIVNGRADYTKGTRFFSAGTLSEMPWPRLLGNAALSFLNKATSGYWGVMDPTNGYTAIHAKILKIVPLARLEKRYFFESDMLFHCGIVRAVVTDVPMFARYGNEVSNLRIGHVLREFPPKIVVRVLKRFLYNYLLRDFNVGSITTLLGLPLMLFGCIFGGITWLQNLHLGIATPTGTVALAAIPFMLGAQLLIASVLFDVANQPREPIHPNLQ